MTKGFGRKQKDEGIFVESMVASRTLTPAVKISWGSNEGVFTPESARHHAYAVLEAIAAAEIDSCFMRWAINELNLEPPQAAQVLILFRQRRQDSKLPSVTINMGNGEHLRPESVKQRAIALFNAAFGTEIEAFLVAFLLQDLEQSPDVADLLVQEFRQMRGAKTAWNGLEGGGSDANS